MACARTTLANLYHYYIPWSPTIPTSEHCSHVQPESEVVTAQALTPIEEDGAEYNTQSHAFVFVRVTLQNALPPRSTVIPDDISYT